jgi:hypothetical protein
MKSWKVNVLALCNLRATNCAIVHNTALWRCGGQSLKCGRYSHSSGTHRGSVLIISANRRLVQLPLVSLSIPGPSD